MRASHSKDCGKGLARLVTMFIFKLNLCKAEIKNFVRKRKFKPPHGGSFPKDDPIQGGAKK